MTLSLEKKFYLIQNQVGEDMYHAVQRVGQETIKKRGLQILLETDKEEFNRTSCLPTTLAVAINLLRGERIFGLGSENNSLNVGIILETAILTHSNDQVEATGKLSQKGYPSIDRRTGNFYHTFLLGFAQRFGLSGMLLTDLLDTTQLVNLTQAGAVTLVSVDNLFVPEVSAKGRGIYKLRVGRHVVLIHGVDGKTREIRFLYSDVFNPLTNDGFVPINLWVAPETLNKYLWTQRMPHISPRMIVLWRRETPPRSYLLGGLSGKVLKVQMNPLLARWPKASFSQYLTNLRDLFLRRYH